MNKYDIEDSIITAQHPFKKLNFNLDLKKRQEEFNKKVGGKKVDWEFQEVGLELNDWFGKKCWFIFYRPEAELSKIKEAFKICRQKKIKNLKYLLGILKTP